MVGKENQLFSFQIRIGKKVILDQVMGTVCLNFNLKYFSVGRGYVHICVQVCSSVCVHIKRPEGWLWISSSIGLHFIIWNKVSLNLDVTADIQTVWLVTPWHPSVSFVHLAPCSYSRCVLFVPDLFMGSGDLNLLSLLPKWRKGVSVWQLSWF